MMLCIFIKMFTYLLYNIISGVHMVLNGSRMLGMSSNSSIELQSKNGSLQNLKTKVYNRFVSFSNMT